MAQNKRQKAILAAVTPGKAYAIDEALKIVKTAVKAKFVESVDVAVRLGVDAKKSDQQVRGSTVLPAGTGKSVRVAVFAPAGAKADEAAAAGAEAVGMDDLAEKMLAGDINYDVVIATPDAMRVVGKLGTVLGPRGLMPNPKVGTVSPNPAEAVKNAKSVNVLHPRRFSPLLSFLIVAYFRDSEDWSTVTPGPMVELTEIFCRYWPFEVAGLAFTRSISSACRFDFSASSSKLALPIVQWMMPALSVR